MREIINFNRKWAFTKMANAVPETMPEKWDIVNLPHSWNTIDGQDGDNDFYRGTCYYAKSFLKGSLPEADRYYLEIKGANSSADVYVNGKHLAHYQHDQYFYDLCDKYGLVIWAEIPYISKHMPTGRENTISQMKEQLLAFNAQLNQIPKN